MTKLLPERTRSQGYQRLGNIGKKLDINVSVCACHNPNIGSSCLAPPASGAYVNVDERGQMDLFGSA